MNTLFKNTKWQSEWAVDPTVLKTIDAASQIVQGLERQDLESELTKLNLLDAPLTDSLTRVQATALQHEYTVVTARHDKIGYAAYADGSVPRKVDVEAVQRRTRPSLIGHRISHTELAQHNTEAGLAAINELLTTEKMIAVVDETEYLSVYGDRSFGSNNYESAQNLQYDGIVNMTKIGAPQNVIDAEGKPLSIALLWAAQNRVVQTQAAAKPQDVYMSYIDKIGLQSQFYGIARTDATERASGVLGANATSFLGAFGESSLTPSRFLGNWHLFSSDGFGSTSGEMGRPSVPGVSVVPTAAALVAPTPNVTGLAAVQRTYYVKASNFYGESAALALAPVTPTLGQQVSFTLNAIDPATKWFTIYVDTGFGIKFLCKVKYTGLGNFVFVDNGFETRDTGYGLFSWKRMEGTGVVFGIDHNTTALAQWLPMEKIELPAQLSKDFVVRHAVSLYARAPEFNFLIVNVGQDITI